MHHEMRSLGSTGLDNHLHRGEGLSLCGRHSFLAQEANSSFCNTLWHTPSRGYCVWPLVLMNCGTLYCQFWLVLFCLKAPTFLGITLNFHCLFFPANIENRGDLTIKYRFFFREENKTFTYNYIPLIYKINKKWNMTYYINLPCITIMFSYTLY